MSISSINSVLSSPSAISTSGLGEAKQVRPLEGSSFESAMTKGIQSVNASLVNAQKMSEAHLTEGKHELHEVMIALEKAELSFNYMTQIRNKVLEAYSEVMRMQV